MDTMSNQQEGNSSSTTNQGKTPGVRIIHKASFLLSVTGISLLGGFGMALAMAKKKDPSFFLKGMMPTKDMPESGGSLAMRALGWGTFYAVTGFSAFCFGVWKLMGVNNLQEFRYKVGNILPEIPKTENPGRSDFKNLREFLNYIVEESEKSKKS
ncbi:transmembrane protein 242-like isoform X2 [Stegodyphus dumicola]|uniref:transmembrane protein 242-like isoform X2 n=1 Tax=Stegodyphus dumicola TaxID=202533 RepID=UPI0015B2FDE6|nr:transmembrane protein 242-like isoform X2 [Stegodyphus dumicola]